MQNVHVECGVCVLAYAFSARTLLIGHPLDIWPTMLSNNGPNSGAAIEAARHYQFFAAACVAWPSTAAAMLHRLSAKTL